MQGRGEGFRIRASVVRSEFLKGGMLQSLAHTFAYLQLVQITQSVLCNRMHEVEQRLARWLLTSADRSGDRSASADTGVPLANAGGAAVHRDGCRG